jgi:hypothetical protein
MSASTQIGGQRVGRVISMLAANGYRCARLSASGQRRGARRIEKGLDADVIALAPEHSGLPHLLVEVGGVKKSVTQSMAEMTEHGPLPPGFIGVVVRLVDSRRKLWRWHTSRLESHPNVGALLAALGDA